MKKDNFFLDLHKQWLKFGIIPHPGLCLAMSRVAYYGRNGHIAIEVFNLLHPTIGDYKFLSWERLSTGFWGSGLKENDDYMRLAYEYTDLRQTIMLFCHELLNN